MKKSRSKLIFRFLPIIFGVILVPTIVSSCALPEELDTTNIVNQFFPNFWVFIAHVIALIILLFVTIYLLWKPTKRAITARNALMQQNIDEAKKAQEEAQIFLQEANEKRLKADMEARQIVNLATHEGFQIKSEIEDNAKRSANRTILNAKSELSRLEIELRKQMHEEIINISISATEALVKKHISKADDEKFVNDFIKELEEIKID